MGEAILTRTTTIPDEILNPINPVPGACILNFKVVDSDNKPVGGMPVTCKDGSLTYTYNTNDTGIVRFTTNSGQCNLTFSNTLNNKVRVLDHATLVQNMVEAPVGTVVNDTIKLNYLTSASLSGTGKAMFLTTNFININLAGGGGGGGGAVDGTMWDGDGSWHEMKANGGSGGTGQGKSINNISIVKNEIYNFSYGYGGRGGSKASADDNNTYAGSGATGGTSYFGSYSSVGGGGGSGAYVELDKFSHPRAYNGKSGSSYSGGGYGGGAGTWYFSAGSYYARPGGDGGSGWLNITMRK